jgi:hypothetical protein
MKKQNLSYLVGGGAVLGLGYLLLRKKTQPKFITAGSKLEAYSGQMFTVRLKRGDYAMMGGDGLTLVSQVPRGDMTDLQIRVDDAPLPFTVTPTFIDKNNDNNQHTVTIKVHAYDEGAPG